MLLMTTGDRYQFYKMQALEGKVFFFKQAVGDKETLSHDMAQLRISTIDTIDRKIVCKSRQHFGAVLSFCKNHRKLFFLNYAQMQAAIDYILEAQGLTAREDQYKLSGVVAQSAEVRRTVVKQIHTQQKFEMKKVLKTSKQAASLKSEINCLQLCSKSSRFVQLIDVFETETHSFALFKHNKQTLGSYLISRERVVTDAEARSIITGVAKSLSKLHENKIVHRLVTHTSIKIKEKSSGLQITLSGFDHAVYLKK